MPERLCLLPQKGEDHVVKDFAPGCGHSLAQGSLMGEAQLLQQPGRRPVFGKNPGGKHLRPQFLKDIGDKGGKGFGHIAFASGGFRQIIGQGEGGKAMAQIVRLQPDPSQKGGGSLFLYVKGAPGLYFLFHLLFHPGQLPGLHGVIPQHIRAVADFQHGRSVCHLRPAQDEAFCFNGHKLPSLQQPVRAHGARLIQHLPGVLLYCPPKLLPELL